jgi:hypothetical protein
MPQEACPKCKGTGELPLFTGTYQCDNCIDGTVYVSPEDTLTCGEPALCDWDIEEFFKELDACLD